MGLHSKLTIPAHVMAREVGDEIVILNLTSGVYFGLDAIGVRIWGLIAEGKTPADIGQVMMNEYLVTQESIERDVCRLIDELQQQGLVTLG